MSGFMNLLTQSPSLLGDAIIMTIVGSAIAAVLAMAIAIPVAFARLSKVTLIRSIATFYVETIRGTPLLLQLLVWFFGVQILLGYLFHFYIETAALNVLTALGSNSLIYDKPSVAGPVFGIFGLAFNYGAYLAEIIRGGIESVDHGQIEAAQMLGLSKFQIARFVVLPQALRIMIPPLTNNFITLVQDTAFLQVLGVVELSLRIQQLTTAISNVTIRWEWYAIELALYFFICYSLALVSRRLESRMSHTLAGAH